MKFLNKTNGQTRCLKVKNVTLFRTEGVIGQYLLNTNENTSLFILQNFLELNKALRALKGQGSIACTMPCLVLKNCPKISEISYHIEY